MCDVYFVNHDIMTCLWNQRREIEAAVWEASRPSRFTPLQNSVPIVQEAEWASGPVWTYLPPGFDPRTVKPKKKSQYQLHYAGRV